MKRARKASKQARRKIIKPDGLAIRCVPDPAGITIFDGRLDGEHDLGSTPSVGDFLRQIVEGMASRSPCSSGGPQLLS